MPDTPALAALRVADRHAENEVLHLALRLANWDPPSVMDLTDAPLLEAHARALTAYRDAVAARVREEEAGKVERAFRVGFRSALNGGIDVEWEQGEWLENRAELLAALPPEGDHA